MQKKKWTMAMIHCLMWLVIVVGVFGCQKIVHVYAQEISGTCGENLTWSILSDNTLTISGSGAMDNYSPYNETYAPWYEYRNSIEYIEVGEGITAIGSYALYGCCNLTSINLPDSITKIGLAAFYDCEKLSSVYMPKGVTEIGDYAFKGCSNLSSIDIPDGVTEIGWSSFEGCSSLSSIDIPDGVTEIGWSSFAGCSSLGSIDIPDGVTKISGDTFSRCSSLISVTIPESVTSIEISAFSDCSGMKSIILPQSLSSLGKQVFCGCSNLENVNIPEGVTEIGDNTFSECSSLSGIVIPESVASIGKSAFSGCSNLESVNIPEGVTEIGDNTFSGCSSLSGIVIPESVASIGKSAFFWCNNLESVNIPEGVTEIGDNTFCGCSSLNGIVIPESVASIGKSAFFGCSNLKSVNILEDVKIISESAFGNCSSMTEVGFSAKVTEIQTDAFVNCYRLKYLFYSGDLDEWESISISDGNTNLTNAIIHYSSKGHVYTKRQSETLAKEATSTEDATYYLQCDYCDTVSSTQTVKKHTIVTDEKVEATCGEDGLTEGSHCSVCKEIIQKQEVIPATGKHTIVTDEKVEATCGEDGLTEGSYCSVCKEIIQKQEVIPATGKHIWNEEKVIREATCTEEGERLYRCSACDEEKIENIGKIEHDTTTINAKESTYATEGYTGDLVCIMCNQVVKKGTSIPVKERIEATGKYALLKAALKHEGLIDSDGNRYFQYKDTVEGIDAIGTITYLDDYAQFKFFYKAISGSGITTIQMVIEENGSQTVTVDFGYEAISLMANSTFETSSYTADGMVYFEKTTSNILENSQIQRLCNAELRAALVQWDLLLLDNFALDINMADMGFTSYEEGGKHTWDSSYSYVSKEPTCTQNGVMTHVCRICMEKKTELIAAKGHGEEVVKDKRDATYSLQGYTGDTYCKDCGEIIKKGEIIPEKEKVSIAEAKVTLSETFYNYDGKNKKPSVKSVVLAGKTLVLNTDYSVSYTNEGQSKNVGTYTVMIIGKGAYEGTAKATYEVKVSEGKTYTVNGYKYKVTNASTNGKGTVVLIGTTKKKSALTTLTIGNTVAIGAKQFKITALGDKAFKGYTKLKTIKIGSDMTIIGKEAFSGCTAVRSVAIGNSVTTISDKAFYNCNKLTKITIPRNVKKIGVSSFQKCAKLKSITLKSTKLTSVGKNAINGIYSKATIKVPKKQYAKYKKLFKSSTGYKETMTIKK